MNSAIHDGHGAASDGLRPRLQPIPDRHPIWKSHHHPPAHAARPPRWHAPAMTAGVILVLVALVATYRSARSVSREAEVRLVRVVEERDAARHQAEEQTAALDWFTRKVDSLEGELGSLRDRVAELETQASEASATADQATEDLLAVREELSAAKAELSVLAGPPIDDGERVGVLHAVAPVGGGSPWVVVDLRQLLTGERAVRAAEKDGVIAPGGELPGGYYLRDVSPRWRIVKIAATAQVSLWSYPGGSVDVPITIDLLTFGEAFDSPDETGSLLRSSPYGITVADGTILSVEQLYLA